MKKTIIISVILGIIFSLFAFINYNNNKDAESVETEVYFLQIGAYKKYDNVSSITKTLPNYLVVKELNLYHVYVGISKSLDNIEKIKVFYTKNGNNIYMRSKNIYCKKFIKNLETYDYLLNKTEDKETIYAVNKEILKSYEGDCIKKDNKI